MPAYLAGRLVRHLSGHPEDEPSFQTGWKLEDGIMAFL